MLLIALTAEKESGKTTVARQLKTDLEYKGYRTKILSFAGPLKQLATDIGWNGKKDEKGRRLLQLLGTDVCRQCIDENYWLKKMDEQLVHADQDAVDIVIIDDLRFLNEYGFVRVHKGFVGKITRRKTPMQMIRSFFSHKHASEAGIPIQLCDYHLQNDGTLEQLYSAVSHCLMPAIFSFRRKQVNG